MMRRDLTSRGWFARMASRTAGACCYAYPLAAIGAWFFLRFRGDQSALATLLLFGPRWMFALPAIVLLPPALFYRRRWLLPVTIGALVAIGPIMGFNLGWRAWGDGVDEGESVIRVLTYNIERWEVSSAAFAELVDQLRPQLVGLQEIPSRRWRVPDGWHVERKGELIVASRFPIERTEVFENRWSRRPIPEVNAMYCVVRTPQGNVGFCNLHLDTPRPALDQVLHPRLVIDFSRINLAEQMLENRRQESADIAAWLAGFPEPKIIAGDFNMPCDSTIYREHWSGRKDSFQRAGFGFGYTKQTTKRGVRYGTRIDHILADSHWRAVRCWLGPDLGSDHLPLIAELAAGQEDDQGAPRK